MLFIHCDGPPTDPSCDEGSLQVAYHAGPNGEHTPYWVPVCGCGFRGEPKYFRGYALVDLREHHEMREGAGATVPDRAPAKRSA